MGVLLASGVSSQRDFVGDTECTTVFKTCTGKRGYGEHKSTRILLEVAGCGVNVPHPSTQRLEPCADGVHSKSK